MLLRWQVWGVVAQTVLLAACARPDSMVPELSKSAIKDEAARQTAFLLERVMGEKARVETVSYRIRTANAEFCGRALGPKYGFSVASLEDFPKTYRKAAKSVLGLTMQTGVIQVVNGSPAARAGLREGDRILRVAGRDVPEGEDGHERIAKTLSRWKGSSAVPLLVERGGAKRIIAVRPVWGCVYPVILADGKNANAYTDGQRIVIHRGLLRLTKTDNELALIVGHELAHITAGHFGKQGQNQIVGMIGGAAADALLAAAGLNTGGALTSSFGRIGRNAFSPDFEKEADYIGLYFAARAGYSIKGVETFWRRMADEDPKSIRFAGTHPTTAERFLVIAKTDGEIAAKRRKGVALRPNKKP